MLSLAAGVAEAAMVNLDQGFIGRLVDNALRSHGFELVTSAQGSPPVSSPAKVLTPITLEQFAIEDLRKKLYSHLDDIDIYSDIDSDH